MYFRLNFNSYTTITYKLQLYCVNLSLFFFLISKEMLMFFSRVNINKRLSLHIAQHSSDKTKAKNTKNYK